MGIYSNFPYTDFNNLNLDWILNNVKLYIEKYMSLEEFVTKSIEEQNKIISEALDNILNYVKDNLETIAKDYIDELIQNGDLYIALNYDAVTEALTIVLTE